MIYRPLYGIRNKQWYDDMLIDVSPLITWIQLPVMMLVELQTDLFAMHIHNVIVIMMFRHFFTTILTMYFLVKAIVAIFAVSFTCLIQINHFVYLLFSST